MYIFTVIFGAVAVLRFYVTAESNAQSDAAGSQATGAKLAVPFASLLGTESYQQDDRRYNFPFDSIYRPSQSKRCPLCDNDLPYQCKLADCRFLHANSCKEHRLIAVCCCSDDYRSLLKSFTKA
ncbi:PREDICTED: uncharacterized protein LOC108575332 [Habropoda laboriosa]|uniref:uncharacterized protein LOC108575332 n=1 Tax=Habropoda laboriosa TaxID=597456 RepID=UPI00083DB00D|nr:PREDICTED: uncharacterized protein LOC108575332 [Habropoda laboriosa]